MKLSTGVDLIEIDRIQRAIERHGKIFLERIYTPKEIAQFGKSIESLAVRFAAKEAVSKALGSGIGDVSWREIEILRDEMDAPVLQLHGQAHLRADLLGLHTWSVSLSHTETHAIAMAVAVGE
ncbi:MAG: holo-ACP synthase [Chloroflexi bacterium]|nr:holo-ACP synthase [Chloroflexota bacterium]MBU1660093.1 holo-ACP synthase [Chloroflexota bacterium]